MMKILIKNLIIFSFITSCKLVKPSVETIHVIKDSIITKTITTYRDTIIRIPGDTIRFQIPCDKDTVFIYRSKNSSSLVQIKDGIVSVQNNCDEKDILITKLYSEIDRYKSQKKDSVVVVTKREKYIPKIYKFYSWGFWFALALGGGIMLVGTNIWTIIIGGVISIIKILKKKK